MYEDSEYEAAAKYITKQTMEAVPDLFTQAHKIKKWLIACSNLAVRNKQPISWITPLGLPVMQHYRRGTSFEKVDTIALTLDLGFKEFNMPLSSSKQKSAFPPNFVHR